MISVILHKRILTGGVKRINCYRWRSEFERSTVTGIDSMRGDEMNRIKIFSKVLSAFLTATLLVGCGSIEKRVVGTWKVMGM